MQYGWTALMWACRKGHVDVVDYLLDRGANVHAEDVNIRLYSVFQSL